MRLRRGLLFVAGAILVVALCAVVVVLVRPLLFGAEEGIPVEGTFICEQTGQKWTGKAYKVNEYDPYVYSKWTKGRTARQAIECAMRGEWVLPPIPKPFSEMTQADVKALTEMTAGEYAAWQEEAEAKPFSEMTQAEAKALGAMTPAEYAAWQEEAEATAFSEMTAAEYKAWEDDAADMLAEALCPECDGPLAPRKLPMGERRKLGAGRTGIPTRKYRSTATRTGTGTARRSHRSERRSVGDGRRLPRARVGPEKRVRGTRKPEPLRADGTGTTGHAKSRPFQRSSRKKVPAFDEFYSYRTRPYSYYRWGGDPYSDVYSRAGPYGRSGPPPLRDMFYRTQPYYRRGREQDFYRAPSRRPYDR
jgi:hypothetical protein